MIDFAYTPFPSKRQLIDHVKERLALVDALFTQINHDSYQCGCINTSTTAIVVYANTEEKYDPLQNITKLYNFTYNELKKVKEAMELYIATFDTKQTEPPSEETTND